MKLFDCVMDDGRSVFRNLTCANNKKELLHVFGGNGEFVRIKDITNEYFTDDSVSNLNSDLVLAGWGEGERTIICALLEEHIRKLKR